jgi:hypothetical protein
MNLARKYPAILTESSYLFQSFVACMGRGIARPASGQVRFFLDTGSQKTILGESDCIKMGIDIGSLPTSSRPLAGRGGTAEAHVIEKLVILMRDASGASREILLEGVLAASVQPRKRRNGRFAPIPSVLGWDVLLKGYHFHCDPTRGEVYLGEWC